MTISDITSKREYRNLGFDWEQPNAHPVYMRIRHAETKKAFDEFKTSQENKVGYINTLLVSPNKLIIELDKCDLLCANCHKIRERSK